MVLEVVKLLTGVKTALLNSEHDYRNRTSEYLMRIADCLERIVAGVECDDFPAAACGELSEYFEGMRAKLKPIMDAKRVERFDELLRDSIHARAMYVESRENKQFRNDLMTASGRFRGLANDIRVV